MNLRRAWAILLRHLYLLRESPARVLPLFAWVAIDIILWGFLTRYLNSVSRAEFNFVPALLGAVLLWDFLTRVMHGVTTAFFEDVWSRNFLNIFASPISIAEYLLGLIGSSLLTSFVGLLVMLVCAAGFGLSFAVYGAAFIPFLMVLFLFGIAIGIVGCSIVLRLGPAAEWFIWPIPALLSPFAGVFYPVSVLPPWMQWIAHALPASYVFEGLRSIIAGGALPSRQFAMGFGLTAIYLVAAGWYFSRTHHTAVRTGLLARYSAESTE